MTKKWMSPRPENCDFCGDSFEEYSHKYFIGGKTIHGPWGILCEWCHNLHGTGLGTGRGQKYDWTTLEKVEG